MREAASMRTNILLTPTEHRSWTAAAKQAGVSLAEYIRRAVERFEGAPTPEELAELEFLSREIPAATDRINAMLAEMNAMIGRSLSPETEREMRNRVMADLMANPVVLDPAILDFSPRLQDAA